MLSSNDSVDWTKGVIRPSLKDTWFLFLGLHIIVGIVGLLASISMFCDIIHSRLYRNSTGAYLLNLVINNLLVLLVQMPMNFFIMLYENWVFGKTMCYIGAVVPYLLMQSSMLTFILMCSDRYRSIAHPSKKQLNVCMCLITIWVASACAATPIVTYMHYRDLHALKIPKIRNNGICWYTGDDYSRIIFVTMVTLTAVAIALILVKTSAELNTKTQLYKLHQAQMKLQDKFADNNNSYSDADSSTGEDLNEKYKEHEWVEREKSAQRYLAAMACLWAACWLPMKIFSTITTKTVETEENVTTFDVVPMILLPISAIGSITTPICFALMKNKTRRKFVKVNEDSEDRVDSCDNKSLMYSSSAKMHDLCTIHGTSQFALASISSDVTR